MKHLLFSTLIVFMGLNLSWIPPAKANTGDATVVAKKNFLDFNTGTSSQAFVGQYNQDLSWTKTVAADQQPAYLPEYKGNKNFTTTTSGSAKLLDIGFINFETRYLKNTHIPGFGQRLQQEA